MVLVDFNNLAYRCLFSATMYNKHTKPSEYGGLMLHMLLTSLNSVENKFSNYGEIILCIDCPWTWRAKLYPEYKKNRKRDDSKLDWGEYFNFQNEFLSELKNSKYKQIFVSEAEADDIIYVLSKHSNEKVLIISEDKDFFQLKSDKIDIYRPIKQEFLPEPEKGIEYALNYHICLGDKVDNIPSIKDNTIETPEYLKWLNEGAIGEFEGVKYKNGGFGPKTCEKFMEDFEANLEANPKMKARFDENRKLIDMSMIPNKIETRILETNLEGEFNKDKMDEFYQKYNLRKLSESVNAIGNHAFTGWDV